MSVASRFMAVVIATACLSVASAASAGAVSSDIDDKAAREWATKHYDAVANEVFASPPIANGPTGNTVWVVTVRVTPAYDQPEIQFSLSKSANDGAAAVVTKLRSSLRLQLQKLYGERGEEPASQIATRIEVDRITVTERQCPALKKMVAAFAKVRPAIALENEMVLDARRYQVWVDAYSQQMYVSLLGPSNGMGRHAIILWVEESLRHLKK